MTRELTYALITPYSLIKSRTGGIIGRLLSQTNLNIVAARMYKPSDIFVNEFCQIITHSNIKKPFKQAFCDYLQANFRESAALERGFTNRFMLLLFEGKNAVKELRKVVGSTTPLYIGNTVRGTYGDCLLRGNKVDYFEPAVLIPHAQKHNLQVLKLLADHSQKNGGVLEKAIKTTNKKSSETTLVMLKPDNFAKRSSKPGNIIDVFANTGLSIVGAHLFSMSIEQGLQFYGFLEDIFVNKLSFLISNVLNKQLQESFDFKVTDTDIKSMTKILQKKNAHCEVAKIIHFMTGLHPDKTPASQRKKPGKTKCLALLYKGENAIDKIRNMLGATDPAKAEGGTVRSDYGRDLMINGAHASDSVKSALRERKIIGLLGGEPSIEKKIIKKYLHSKNCL